MTNETDGAILSPPVLRWCLRQNKLIRAVRQLRDPVNGFRTDPLLDSVVNSTDGELISVIVHLKKEQIFSNSTLPLFTNLITLSDLQALPTLKGAQSVSSQRH